MICKNCGQSVEPGSAFCPECGQQFPVERQAVPPQSIPQQAAPPQSIPQQAVPPQSIPQQEVPPLGVSQQVNPQQPDNAVVPKEQSAYGQAPQMPSAGYPAPSYPGQYPGEMQPPEPQKKKPLWLLFVALGVVVVACAIIGITVFTKNAAIKDAVTEMEQAVTQATELSKEVDAMFLDSEPSYPKAGLTAKEVEDLQKKISEIKREPNEKYVKEVKEKVKLSEHKKLLNDMEEKLDGVAEKTTALEEVNAVFEVEAVAEGTYQDVLPIAPGMTEEEIKLLLDKYTEKEGKDAFWDAVVYVLDDATYEISWIMDARTAVKYLEAKPSFDKASFDSAQQEIDYLYDGTQKTEMQGKLDALSSKITKDEKTPAETPPATTPETEQGTGGTGNMMDYDTLEAFVKDNKSIFNIEEMNASFAGMAEADVFAVGNVLTIQVKYTSQWDSLMDSMAEQLEAQMDSVDEVYEPLAEMLRAQFPEAKLILEFCKSNGDAVVSKTY